MGYSHKGYSDRKFGLNALAQRFENNDIATSNSNPYFYLQLPYIQDSIAVHTTSVWFYVAYIDTVQCDNLLRFTDKFGVLSILGSKIDNTSLGSFLSPFLILFLLVLKIGLNLYWNIIKIVGKISNW